MTSELDVYDLQLSNDEFDQIERLAGLNYSPEKIAMYLGKDKQRFIQLWMDPDSELRFHYEKGALAVQAESDQELVKAAKGGNITAYQQYLKQALFQRIDNVKKRLQMDMEISTSDRIREYIENGKVGNIPESEIQLYEQWDMVRCLFNKNNSKSFIISALLKSYKSLSRTKAYEIYADSLNFFNLNKEVKVEAWGNIYADRLDNAAAICLEMNDFETYRRIIKDAAEMRGVGKDKPMELPEGFYNDKPVFYVMDPEIVKVKREDRNRLIQWLYSLPDLSEEDKNRFNRDALIEDAEFTIIEDPDEN